VVVIGFLRRHFAFLARPILDLSNFRVEAGRELTKQSRADLGALRSQGERGDSGVGEAAGAAAAAHAGRAGAEVGVRSRARVAALLGEAIRDSCCSRFALWQDLQTGVSPDITSVWNSSPQERQRWAKIGIFGSPGYIRYCEYVPVDAQRQGRAGRPPVLSTVIVSEAKQSMPPGAVVASRRRSNSRRRARRPSLRA
jgi:hypothetical protein